MENKLTYSFDDVPVRKSYYDLYNKKIEVHFNGYYDVIRDMDVEKPCVWTIENWEYAKSQIGDEQRRYDLKYHMGIFDLILYMKYNKNNELELCALTIDNRCPILFFKNPELSLREEI